MVLRASFFGALVFVAALALTGCAGSRALEGDTVVSVYPGDQLPAPLRSDLIGPTQPYFIGPFDRLKIDVFGSEDLSNKEVQTDAGGNISFPLVGTVEAAGLTAEELSHQIADRLRGRFVRDPQVTVNIEETKSQLVTVEGEVTEPGLYPVQGKLTLLRAIAKAKGTNDRARLGDVVVFRTVDGQKLAALYNLRAVRKGNYPDPELFANDVVVVGDSKARQFFRDFLSIAPLLSTPIIIALRGY